MGHSEYHLWHLWCPGVEPPSSSLRGHILGLCRWRGGAEHTGVAWMEDEVPPSASALSPPR